MPITEVPMFRAACDVCGAGLPDSDYWAWADAGQALEDWRDSDRLALDDGRLFCDECTPAVVCPMSDDHSGKHSPSDDGLSCVECDRPLAPVGAS